MTPALLAYRALAGMAEPFLPGLLRARARRGKEEPARLAERLGREPGARPAGRLIHLHGASVGEGLSLLPLAQALRAQAPDATLLVTSATVSSAALLAQRLPAGLLHRYAPVDAPGATRRWVRRWRPDLSVFAESELWPNWLADLRRAGGRTALVSARLSEASVRGWERAPRAARTVFGGFDLVLAQDADAADSLARLGAPTPGRLNLKLAGGALPLDAAALARARRQAAGARVLLAASTHPGEDDVALAAFEALARTDALLVVAPRHAGRGRAVVDLARARRLPVALRSAGFPLRPGEVHVADTLGELGLWFALAAEGGSTLVGGSLVAGVGGHNPLEPVRAFAPVVRGPHVANWPGVYAALGDTAPTVADAPALARAWRADLDDAQGAACRASFAHARVQALDPDMGDVTRRLLDLLPPAA